jgi:thymidine phosphorylase
MLVRLGQQVQPGQPVLRVFAPRERFEKIRPMLAAAFTLSDQPVTPPPLVHARLT